MEHMNVYVKLDISFKLMKSNVKVYVLIVIFIKITMYVHTISSVNLFRLIERLESW